MRIRSSVGDQAVPRPDPRLLRELDVSLRAQSEQDRVGLDLGLSDASDRSSPSLDPAELGTGQHADAGLVEPGRDPLGHLGADPGQLRCLLVGGERDRAAQRGDGDRRLAADEAGSDHERLGPRPSGLAQGVAVGEIPKRSHGRVVQPRQLGQRRARAGGEHEAPRTSTRARRMS